MSASTHCDGETTMDDQAPRPELLTVIAGTFVAFAIAFLRRFYDDTTPKIARVLLEAAICSGISVSAIALIFFTFSELSSNLDLSVIMGGGVGAFVGFIGVHQIRRLILKFINSKIKDD